MRNSALRLEALVITLANSAKRQRRGNASIAGVGPGHTVVDRPAGGRCGDTEARRNADLHDPGRCTTELRRPSRSDVCDGSCGGTVLQRVDPGEPGQPG